MRLPVNIEAHRKIAAIQAVLTPDLLKPPYRGLPGGRMAGHCYHASEALYHAYGRDAGFKPHVLTIEGVTHWWLQPPLFSKQRLDPTAEQFTSRGLVPDYSKGRGCGFLTKAPSRRAQEVLRRAFGVQILDVGLLT